MDVNKYIELLEKRDAHLAKHERFLEAYIELKDYNTSLRIAISNIPTDNKKKTSQAVKKAKRLAAKEPVLKKRKREEPIGPKVKRTYKKRKSLATTSDAIKKDHSVSLDRTSEEESSDEEDENSSSNDSRSQDDEYKETKATLVIQDTFI